MESRRWTLVIEPRWAVKVQGAGQGSKIPVMKAGSCDRFVKNIGVSSYEVQKQILVARLLSILICRQRASGASPLDNPV